ncbi:hypothetical protein M441DRAFT_199660 [Trichoderma asperellum CBS 433.97]|uniref:Glycosyltransferase family 1 protein n=1 Tax=Trichoderma asperellum (strain ATCC 204424 / CBS 433.97 / NBRC 101777) TaxID=1042311 RepID=A0A2T3Z0S7_TRIA4|nr:hypothetical protein M441DRAFT_199660 [Trichoderma asperellum CBS 433.97]PTB38405.1 hypothetical protein M441DRAFT_199660 [Trichoderma asperellum CBS 433.97]
MKENQHLVHHDATTKTRHGQPSTSPTSIVFNAQPFGGGPGATLTAVMPYLRSRLKSLGPIALHYVGSSLTMDFQKLTETKWDGIHNVDLYTNPEIGKRKLVSLLQHLKPQLVVTAMDELVAAAAQAAGIPVVIIDLLLWFWPSISPNWRQAELVIAAEFYGVQERIISENLNNVATVPPLGPPARTTQDPSADVLLNFGGMINPLMPKQEYIAYSHLIYSAARRAIELRNAALPESQHAKLIVLVASFDVAQGIDPKDPEAARMVLPDEALKLMASSELTFCTAGLGNLYAAGAVANAVLLLPPLHEGHAIQTHLIQKAGVPVDAIEWHELTGRAPIDYYRDSLQVMDNVSKAQSEVIDSPQAQTALVGRMLAAMLRSASAGVSAEDPPLRTLIKEFGQDNGDAMAVQIMDVLEKVR